MSGRLASAQLALSFALLVGAGLLVRSLVNAQTYDPGFRVDGIAAAQLNLELVRRRGEREVARLLDAVAQRLEALPDVAAIAFTSHPPLAVPQRTRTLRRAGELFGDGAPAAALNAVSAGYFGALDIHVIAGRTFANRDFESGAPPTAVISESAKRRLWPHDEAVGQQLDIGGLVHIIGVVSDVKLRSLSDRDLAAVYVPIPPVPPTSLTLIVRARHNTAAALILPTLRDIDQDLVVLSSAPFRTLLGRAYGEIRTVAILLVVFGGIAAVLSAAGIYVVLAAWVSSRRRELAIRLAVGASSQKLAAMVWRRAAAPVIGGLSVGAAIAVATTRALRSLLFGVTTLDLFAYATAAVVLLIVCVIAAYVPMRRAMRADPILMLRGV